jgi:SAM-dependent methyltransferase
MNDVQIKENVKKSYSTIALDQARGKPGATTCCGPSSSASSCCGPAANDKATSAVLGYGKAELENLPQGADLGLGCGNPTAMASIKPGEVVLDLGSGAGIDCFIASTKVGEHGRVIGVDMTPAMIDLAKKNAQKNTTSGGYDNVEFRLGEIESLPVADNEVDLIISNCVINLVPDKLRAFHEMRRVLKPGGRIMISDIVLDGKIPDKISESIAAYAACISGALQKDEYLDAIKKAGLEDVAVISETRAPIDLWLSSVQESQIAEEFGVTLNEAQNAIASISSILVTAIKK